MCRFSIPPGYQRSKPPEKPKLGPLMPVIDAILAADRSAPPKQRHTAKRIFERLWAEYDYASGYTVVKDFVRLKRARMKEAFVPLAHPSGHAQVDSGQCIGVIGSVRTVYRANRVVRPSRSASAAPDQPKTMTPEERYRVLNDRMRNYFPVIA